MSWERAKSDAFKSIAARAESEPVGRLPAVFGPSGERLAGSMATVGLHLLDDILDRRLLPVRPMMRAELFRAIENNVTGDRAERAADLFSRALLAAAIEHPAERDAPERWAERLMQNYNSSRPHQDDIEEVAVLASIFDSPADEFDEDAEDAFDRRRRFFCVHVGRRGMEFVVGTELPDSAEGFLSDVLQAAEYDELWLDAHGSMLQLIKRTAELGVEATDGHTERPDEGEADTSSRWTLSGLRDEGEEFVERVRDRIRRR